MVKKLLKMSAMRTLLAFHTNLTKIPNRLIMIIILLTLNYQIE